jgi:hypothetical protein
MPGNELSPVGYLSVLARSGPPDARNELHDLGFLPYHRLALIPNLQAEETPDLSHHLELTILQSHFFNYQYT